jgi:hypothetical protein
MENPLMIIKKLFLSKNNYQNLTKIFFNNTPLINAMFYKIINMHTKIILIFFKMFTFTLLCIISI